MTQKIRWGVLSTANIGEFQVIPAIQQSRNSIVTAVASRDLERAKAFASRLNIAKAYGSYPELLADPDIDAVYIPLPNDQHFTWGMRCADAGKPLLCEKPLTLNATEAQQLADAFAKRGLPLAEAFMYRFHPQTEQVKTMIQSGAVGDLRLVQATFNFVIGNEDNIRLQKGMGGGALYDIGCYCLNAMRYMTGEEPAHIEADANFGAQSQVDESLVGIVRFPSGVLGHFDCSFRSHFTQTYEIRGTKERILVESAFRPDVVNEVLIRRWGADGSYEQIKVDNPNQYTLMVEDFADALLNKRSPRFPIQDSIANMRAIDHVLAAAHRHHPNKG